MSYFDPNVYNVEHLKPGDRRELEFWEETIENIIANALEAPGDGRELSIVREVKEQLEKDLREEAGNQLFDVMVSVISGYSDDEWDALDKQAWANGWRPEPNPFDRHKNEGEEQ